MYGDIESMGYFDPGRKNRKLNKGYIFNIFYVNYMKKVFDLDIIYVILYIVKDMVCFRSGRSRLRVFRRSETTHLCIHPRDCFPFLRTNPQTRIK